MTTPTVPIEKGAALRMHAVIDSPIGPLTLVTEGGALTGLYMDVQGHEPD
jgi:methylated-DNA-[protein]-cysteine S-methyltransferase